MESVQEIKELNVAYGTHEGMSGKHNEDTPGLFAWKAGKRQIFNLGVVADGVGGQIAGEVASRLAVEAISSYFDRQSELTNINDQLEQAILAANKAVYDASQVNPDYRGMSTTIAIAAVVDGRLYTAHVGDSRIYLLRDTRLRQISTDHTWAQEAIEAGLLTREQAKTHPNRNVIRRHLGGAPEVEVDHRMVLEAAQSPAAAKANQGTTLKAGDTLLICSDGLTDMITDDEVLKSLLNYYTDLPTAVQELIDKANQAGGKDNITVVTLQVPPTGAQVAAAKAAASSASAAAEAVVPQPVTAAPPTSAPRVAPAPAAAEGRGLSTVVIAGIAGLVIIGIVAVAFVVFGGLGGGNETPTPTLAPGEVPPTDTLEAGAPATAAILATAGAGTGTTLAPELQDTPAVIPTLRSTFTSTPVRPVILPTTPGTPSATPTNTPVPSGGGSSGGGSSGGATSTTQPPTATNTPVPPTNTPVPPTNTPVPATTESPIKTPGTDLTPVLDIDY